jgi:hypothetical protein
MPIRINLLEEEQKAKLARKRDPVMLAVRLSVLGVVTVLVFSVVLYTRVGAMNEQVTALKNEWKQRETKFGQTEKDIKNLQKRVAKSDLLRAQVKNRFLWAPQLELYKDIIPTTVQITRFLGKREITTPAPAAKGGPTSPVEVVRVTLEGTAEGGRPELVVHDFLTQLKASPKLTENVEEIKLVSLTKGTPARGRADEDSPSEPVSARFVIDIQYKQRPLKPV